LALAAGPNRQVSPFNNGPLANRKLVGANIDRAILQFSRALNSNPAPDNSKIFTEPELSMTKLSGTIGYPGDAESEPESDLRTIDGALAGGGESRLKIQSPNDGKLCMRYAVDFENTSEICWSQPIPQICPAVL